MNTQDLLKLRELTGAGILEAKKAIEEAHGDLNEAVEFLRKKGLAKAAGKAERQTAEGLVHAYIHGNGKVGAMVEILCETDFVAKTDTFKELAHDLVMHVAASNPSYISPADIPEELLEKEKEIWAEELHGKPKAALEKILQGKLEKYYSEVCFLNQSFVKDEDIAVSEHIGRAIAKLGENIRVRRFVRFAITESGTARVCEGR